jgi:hypothetical protein
MLLFFLPKDPNKTKHKISLKDIFSYSHNFSPSATAAAATGRA